MKTGMCSITFRSLGREALVALVAKAGLNAIEWGGDIHVPHGDLRAARDARRLTKEAGLEVCSYGSYFSPVDESGTVQDYMPILETTAELDAKVVRIWAGRCGSNDMTVEWRNALVEKTRAMANAASGMDIRIAFEFHMHTLTDTNESASALLEEIGHPNVHSYWQPPYWKTDMAYRLNGLKTLGDRLLNLHVFHWLCDPDPDKDWGERIERRPLSEGIDEWKTYFDAAAGRAEVALLEFTANDDPEQFLQDAAALRILIGER